MKLSIVSGIPAALQHQEDPPVVHPGIRAREIGKRDTSILTQTRAVDDGRCFNFEDAVRCDPCGTHLCDEWMHSTEYFLGPAAHCRGQDFAIVVTESKGTQCIRSTDQPSVSIDTVRLREKDRPAGRKAIRRSSATKDVL